MGEHSWFYVVAGEKSQVVWCQVCGCLKLDIRSPDGWVPSYRKVGATSWSIDAPPCATHNLAGPT